MQEGKLESFSNRIMETNVVIVNDEECPPDSQLDYCRVQPLLCSPCNPEVFSKSVHDDDDDEKKKPATILTDRFNSFMHHLGIKMGFEEFTSLDMWRASVAELVGMTGLIFAMDTLVMGTLETDSQGLPFLVMSILMGITLSVILLATFPISGGYLNPAISFTGALVGMISMTRAFIYIIAQCIGATLGALAVKAVISEEIQSEFMLGGCALSFTSGSTTVSMSTAQGFWLETLAMFVVLFGACGIGFNRSGILGPSPNVMFSIIGTMVGLMTYATSTVTTVKGYAGAGMNPARCFGPAVVRGGQMWDRHWVFWVGPAVASIAFYIFVKAIPRETFYSKK